ncbi:MULTISPECIES: MBL fold metallo-hydrolase [unclassified Pseudomonas]|uniref:MBL fold metallo-hydrolase n=1 Tax=unclassified Pseudomonas TaxID=196821 RepID=UPI001039120C|nr:MBL fold metallo-hydrolase [Pseudomonas sp. IC_126]TCD21349.1 MBL fold metallo-hydrolase [Pseudomonas sp. IC_126]
MSAPSLEHELRFPWAEPPAPGEVQEVAEGVLWLRMPLPFGLDHINLYLLRHGDGWVVVDTGLGIPRSREVWERVFVEVMGGLPVLSVICTHCHFDHTGLAAWLTERFRCPLYMTRGEFQAMHVSPEGSEPGWEFHDFYHRAGLNDEEIAGLMPTIESLRFDAGHPRSYRRLREGTLLKIGTRHWRVVIGAGHSPEHACLLSEDDQLLISGDQVLPRITSSVLVGAGEPCANPLGDWLDSIHRLRAVPDEVLVLPAHERPFFGLHRRLYQLQQHHERHLAELVERIEGAMTAAELRPLLFPRIKGAFDLLMSLGETLAHIHYLVEKGTLTREQADGTWRFRRTDASSLGLDLPEDIHI